MLLEDKKKKDAGMAKLDAKVQELVAREQKREKELATLRRHTAGLDVVTGTSRSLPHGRSQTSAAFDKSYNDQFQTQVPAPALPCLTPHWPPPIIDSVDPPTSLLHRLFLISLRQGEGLARGVEARQAGYRAVREGLGGCRS
jgi:hypothetical protein